MELLIDKIQSVVRNTELAEKFGERTHTYGFIAQALSNMNIDHDEKGNRFASLIDKLDFVAVLDLVCDWMGDVKYVEGDFTEPGIYRFSKTVIDKVPIVFATYQCKSYV